MISFGGVEIRAMVDQDHQQDRRIFRRRALAKDVVEHAHDSCIE